MAFLSSIAGSHVVFAAYGAVCLHHWTERAVRLQSGAIECTLCLELFRRLSVPASPVSEECQRRVHERRRTAVKEIAVLWSMILDVFLVSLLAALACGFELPTLGGMALLVSLSTGRMIIKSLGDLHDLSPDRLDRDMTVVSALVFTATFGMPRELMAGCYMARIMCFSFANSKLGNKVNVMLAPCYVLSHWLSSSTNAPLESLIFYCLNEIVAVALMILVVTNLETKETDLAMATLELEAKVQEVQEAEREGGAAQRLLAVTCDASVRLTHDLKIQTPSRSLLDLLMCHFGSITTNQLDGTPFMRYIAAADHQRFTDFIDESSRASAPPRSLHIDMKDSSGVTFATELLHVTVPSLRGEKQEHLIGIMNTDGQSADRAGRTELEPASCQQLPQPLLALSQQVPGLGACDMKHILGYGVRSAAASRPVSGGSKSSSSKSSSSASSKRKRRSLTKLDSLERINIVVDMKSMQEDFLIRSLTLTFSSAATCATDELPNLLEWLKPNYKQTVQNWIQSQANAHFAGESCKELPLRGIKMISPFPSHSSLLVGEFQMREIEDAIEEEMSSPHSGSASSMPIMYINLELRQLFLH